MTVVVLRKSERINKSGKMFVSSETENLTRVDKQQQRWCEESQSRVSFPPEDGLSSESSLCRTMRPVSLVGHQYTHYKSHHKNRSSSNRFSTQKSRTFSSSNLTSTHSTPFLNLSSDNMFDKNIQKSIGTLSGSRLAKLFRCGTGKTCSHSQYYPKLTSPPTESLVPSSTPHKSYNHHQHLWTSFGMILIAIIFLSTFSTSSMVMCVPLGESRGSGVEEARRTAGVTGLMMGMTPLELHRKLQENNDEQHEEPSEGEMYVPTLQHGGGIVAEQTMEHSNLNTPSNYHLLNKKQSQTPIQKLHHKGITRSIMENTIDDEEDDDNDFNETGNRLETMIAQPPISSSSSSLMDLGRIALADGGVGGGDDDPNSTADLMDQSPSRGESAGQWETVIDPHLYVLTEWNRSPFQGRQQPDQQYSMFRQQRKRRNSGTGPSLSIVNPLDVLRQRLLLEIARRRMRQSHNQIIANEEILRKIGRR